MSTSTAAAAPEAPTTGVEDSQTPKASATPEFETIALTDDLESLSSPELRELIQGRDVQIRTLQAQVRELKSAHEELEQRSTAWKDELEALKKASSQEKATVSPNAAGLTATSPTASASAGDEAVSALRAENEKLRATNSALEDQVRDLRIRSEESRRAIMRLQNEQSDIRAKAKAENRRSLATPQPGGAGAGTFSPSTWNSATLAQMADAEEARELRKSKRASLAFGPNAAGQRTSYASAHRRTASGGSTGTNGTAATANGMPGVHVDASSGAESESEADGPAAESAPLPSSSPAPGQSNGTARAPMRMSGGLRGLRLSGMFSAGGSGASGLAAPDNDDRTSSSRRTSFNSAAGGSVRSPVSDVPPDSALSDGVASDFGSISRGRFSFTGGVWPSLSQRQSSTSSILSTGTAGDDGLASNGRPFSVSPSPSLHSKVGSPILEEQDGAGSGHFADRTAGGDDTIEAESPRSRFATLTSVRNNNNRQTVANAVAAAAASAAAQAELQAEVARLKSELAQTRNKYEEAEEARVASEVCLRALKDFIAKHDDADGDDKAAPPPLPSKNAVAAGVYTPSTPKSTSTLTAGQTAALKGLKLPPLPSSSEREEEQTPVAPSAPASSSIASTASSLWGSSSSGWGARFSGFPQLIRMSTSSSTASNGSANPSSATAASTAQAKPNGAVSGSSAVSTPASELALSPAASVTSPPATPQLDAPAPAPASVSTPAAPATPPPNSASAVTAVAAPS